MTKYSFPQSVFQKCLHPVIAFSIFQFLLKNYEAENKLLPLILGYTNMNSIVVIVGVWQLRTFKQGPPWSFIHLVCLQSSQLHTPSQVKNDFFPFNLEITDKVYFFLEVFLLLFYFLLSILTLFCCVFCSLSYC